MKIGDRVIINELNVDPQNQRYKNGTEAIVLDFPIMIGSNLVKVRAVGQPEGFVFIRQDHIFLAPSRPPEPIPEFKIGDKCRLIRDEDPFSAGEEVEIVAFSKNNSTRLIYVKNNKNIGTAIFIANLKSVKRLENDQEVYVKMKFLSYDNEGDMCLSYLDYENDNDDISIKPNHELFFRDSDGCLKKYN